MGGEGGREGDWECSSCNNRNYAFRSFCNRCKQPRLLVDTKTPSDSKWLPRIGDWICTGQLLCPQPPTNQSISFLFRLFMVMLYELGFRSCFCVQSSHLFPHDLVLLFPFGSYMEHSLVTKHSFAKWIDTIFLGFFKYYLFLSITSLHVFSGSRTYLFKLTSYLYASETTQFRMLYVGCRRPYCKISLVSTNF